MITWLLEHPYTAGILTMVVFNLLVVIALAWLAMHFYCVKQKPMSAGDKK